ncbi:MAG: EAL domain-containing protein [Kordiimonadaceae bacterium]|nr:EAL domain-containing protein [Kordiimonadaceae bacterium]MBO6570555.1 EAL domain-containing protein [Kordiimonadaceae bacterium]
MAKMRFQTKLTIVYVALFLAVQSVIILAIYSSVTQNVRDQIRDQLAASARVFDQLISNRVEVFGSRAQDISKDFGFRQAVATRDQATIESALLNLINRLDNDSAFVIDLDDELVAIAGGTAIAENAVNLPDSLKDAAQNDGYAARFVAIGGEIFEIVIAPVEAPVTIGWVGLGIRLDQQVASELKELSPIQLELAFTYDSDAGHQLATATSDEARMRDFLQAQQGHEVDEEFEGSFAGQDYMIRRLPLDDNFSDGENVDALLYYSVDVGLTPFQSLVIALVSILAVGLLMLFFGSLIVARGITRPLRSLARAAQKISDGDYQEVTAPAKDEEISRLTGSFNQMITAVREREERITFQACHDSDSGLPNRVYFEEQIVDILNKKQPFALGVLEIQGISELRAVLTQEHMTEMVRGVAHRLNGININYLSQTSTDSFVFAHFDEKTAAACCAMIINSFNDPLPIGDLMIDLRVSVGLTRFPQDADSVSSLLRHANSALDGARVSEQGYSWYDAELSAAQKDKLSMMSDLREAISSGELKFAYQPKLDLATGKIASVEALMRWISPSRGFVPPDEFISMAEKTGDIRRLTDWALETAVQQAAEWRKQGHEIAVAVNLSTTDLMNSKLPNQVLDLLRKHALPASFLKLEVTESAVMHDMSRALDVLNMLSAMGIFLSIDDYGTGYSSLSYIKSLPVSEIKIDKSFVLKLAEDEEDKILVRSTIELAHNLGMQVTAEGVEDEQSLGLLKSYGCNTLQGYYICRPVPNDELIEFINEFEYAA